MAEKVLEYGYKYEVLLSVKLLNFSYKNVLEAGLSSGQLSRVECSHVMIQRIDKEKHRIVVFNESNEVGYCMLCCILLSWRYK